MTLYQSLHLLAKQEIDLMSKKRRKAMNLATQTESDASSSTKQVQVQVAYVDAQAQCTSAVQIVEDRQEVQIKTENETDSENGREEGEDDSNDRSATIGLQSTMKSVIHASHYPEVGLSTIQRPSQTEAGVQPQNQQRMEANCSFISAESFRSNSASSESVDGAKKKQF